MDIHVIPFGITGEIIGRSSMTLKDIKTIKALQEYLFDEYPRLKQYTFQYAVNDELAHHLSKTFTNNDEVALIPPYAGG